jgi:hypothetical protein
MRAGLHRQCLFGGLRIGLYEPVKTLYMGKNPTGPAPFYKKARVAAAPCMRFLEQRNLPGMTCGVFAVTCMLGVTPCIWAGRVKCEGQHRSKRAVHGES